jgi:hypothetical protein
MMFGGNLHMLMFSFLPPPCVSWGSWDKQTRLHQTHDSTVASSGLEGDSQCFVFLLVIVYKNFVTLIFNRL